MAGNDDPIRDPPAPAVKPAAALAVKCPSCGADPGRRCHTGDGLHYTKFPHARRRKLAEEKTDA